MESEVVSAKMGNKTTVVHATLPNGFEVVATSACNNPEDYDPDVGIEIALERLQDKIWELVGFQAHGEL